MNAILKNQNLSKIALINEQLVGLIPESFSSKSKLIKWLNNNPYSPYITLYGGEKAIFFDKTKSFTSPTDNKKRFILEDEISFKFENFINFENKILSANTKLSNIINSKELFKNYPDFEDLEININISNANNEFYSGSTLHDNNKAKKINVYASSNKNAMRVLLHELQHCIQLKEDFKIGTSYYNEYGVMDLFVGLSKYQTLNEAKEILAKDTMFDDKVLFQEIYDNPEYFNENKNGLKVKLIQINPYDYLEAINKIKPNHTHSEKKLLSLKDAYDKGIKVPVPYLTYGSRDEASSDFGQEGYNRAVNATYIGRKTIPVFVRYREDDENIPEVIKNALGFEKSAFSDIATKKSMIELNDKDIKVKKFRIDIKEAVAHIIYTLKTGGFEKESIEERINSFKKFTNYSLEDLIKEHIALKEELDFLLKNKQPNLQKIKEIIHKKEPYETVLNTMENHTTGKLEDFIEYDKLFLKYPTLKEIRIIIDKDLESKGIYKGKTDSQGELIILKDFSLDVLLHEIQHSIQKIEGWARGGNIDEFKNINELKSLYKSQKEEIENLYNYKEWEFEILSNDLNKYSELLKKGEKDYSLSPFYEEFVKEKKLPKDEAQYFINKMIFFDNNISSLKESNSPYESYMRLWGEQQARAVQYRMNMNHDERLKESWTETLKKVEGNYNTPIIKYKEPHQENLISHLKKINKKELILILEDKLIEDIKKKGKEKTFLKFFGKSLEDFKLSYEETKKEIISSLSSYENYINLEQEKIYSDAILNIINNNYEELAKIASENNFDFLSETKYSIKNILEKKNNEDKLFFVSTRDNEDGAFSLLVNKQKMKEIDDSKSKIIHKGFKELFLNYSTYVENLLEHDELFNIYPFLKDIKIYTTIDDTSFDGQNIFIARRYLSPKNKDEVKSVLLHELQHVVQNFENWARGGNVEHFENLKVNSNIMAKEIEYKVERFENQLSDEADMIIKNNHEDILKKVEDWATKNNYEESLFDNLKDKIHSYLMDTNRNFKDMYKKMNDLKYGDRESSFEKYRRLLGEQQARAVQYRMNMSHDERLKESWTETLRKVEGNYKEPIVKYQNGVSYFDNNKGLKEWHKDSSSLTKKEDNTPKIFYHGTKSDISIFKGNTIWVAQSNDLSYEYSLKGLDSENSYDGANILPVYIKAKNLLEIRKPTIISTEYDFVLEIINNNLSKIKSDNELKIKILDSLKKLDTTSKKPLFEIWDKSESVIQIFKDLGYDGIATIESNSRTIGVFNPTQIKSIHNRGTYDSFNPNILEKNDLGLRNLEMILSIIPNGMKIENVKKYLYFNNLSHENIKNTIYRDIFNDTKFNAKKLNFLKNNKIDLDSEYFQSAGEIEARKIENLYLEKSKNILEDNEYNQNYEIGR